MKGWNRKRKQQGASGDYEVKYEVDVTIADEEKADAVCQIDDGCINDLKETPYKICERS